MWRANVGIRRSCTPGAAASTSSSADPPVLRRVRIGAHVHEDGGVGQPGTGAPHLLPVHDEVVVVLDRGSAQRGRVGSGIGLADRDGVVAPARHDLRHQVTALTLVAELEHRERGDEPAREAHRDVEAGAAELLGDDRELSWTGTGAAVLLGERKAVPLRIRERGGEQIRRGGVVVPRLGHFGRTVPLHEGARCRSQHLLLVVESELHACDPQPS